jgi:hypothetical protein
MGDPRQSALKLSRPRIRTVLLVLLVLVSFAAVQTASAIEIHPDHHGGPNDHCCAGCHAGHFPVLPSVGTLQLAGLAVTAWRAGIEVAHYTSDDGRTFNSSRAPPA